MICLGELKLSREADLICWLSQLNKDVDRATKTLNEMLKLTTVSLATQNLWALCVDYSMEPLRKF